MRAVGIGIGETVEYEGLRWLVVNEILGAWPDDRPMRNLVLRRTISSRFGSGIEVAWVNEERAATAAPGDGEGE